MWYAYDASIVSRSKNSPAKVTDIVAVCGSFKLTALDVSTETMRLIKNRMDKVTFGTETARHLTKFVYHWRNWVQGRRPCCPN